MDLSVIIPAFNAQKYIRETIDSIVSQPKKDIEIVIVDDGSNDNTPAICDEVASKNSQIVCIHKENGGVSSARNTGIEYVLNKHGEKRFIAFLDADDAWNKDIITANIGDDYSDADMLIYGSVRTTEDLRKFRTPIKFQNRNYGGGRTLFGSLTLTSAVSFIHLNC